MTSELDAAEFARLKAIVDSLPKTADEVPYVHTVTPKPWRVEPFKPYRIVEATAVFYSRGWKASFLLSVVYRYKEIPIENCYSTKEAAKAAREARYGKGN